MRQRVLLTFCKWASRPHRGMSTLGANEGEKITMLAATKKNDRAKDISEVSATSEANASVGPVHVVEGKASIEFPSAEEVFYNPVQEFNRDLSIAVIQLFLDQHEGTKKSFGPAGVTLLEALSASGLRSIRYAKEIRGLDQVVANDISLKAVASIEKNVAANGVEHLVKASHNDASMAMYERRRIKDRLAIIDLDPYGSPTPFLDAAIQSVADGGLICVTCTDMAVLCGNAPETCYTKYGAICFKSKCCHEMALRIALQCVESHANRYGRYIEPLLSLSVDFYCRLFVRVFTGQKQCKRTTSKLGHVYQCAGCESIEVQPLGKILEADGEGSGQTKYKLCTGPPVNKRCHLCDRPYHIGGPFWIAPIHNADFVGQLIDSLDNRSDDFGTYDRMLGMLSVVSEELHDVPFYYTQDRLCGLMRVASGKLLVFRSALLNAGYRVSLSHANKLALKTDAPNDFLWAMMRAWEKKNPVNREKLPKDSVALALLDGHDDSNFKPISFELHPEANPASRVQQLKRFQVNPERNWGPKTRAAAGTFKDSEKRARNQGKKRKREMTADLDGEAGEDNDAVNQPIQGGRPKL